MILTRIGRFTFLLALLVAPCTAQDARDDLGSIARAVADTVTLPELRELPFDETITGWLQDMVEEELTAAGLPRSAEEAAALGVESAVEDLQNGITKIYRHLGLQSMLTCTDGTTFNRTEQWMRRLELEHGIIIVPIGGRATRAIHEAFAAGYNAVAEQVLILHNAADLPQKVWQSMPAKLCRDANGGT